jgi:hypothetical protein
MDAFIYNADIYCDSCGIDIRNNIQKDGKDPSNWNDESSYDSDDFPKGPIADGGGEADSPQHCANCHCFLENPLTMDGTSSMFDMILEFMNGQGGNREVINEWVDYYDVSIKDLLNHGATKQRKNNVP